jgi:ABC-type multidrug transport system fused ATPase/permease subunit
MTADELGYIDDAIRMITPAHGVQDKPDALALKVTRGEIAFNDVTFDFPGQIVFQNLSLTIAPGQKVGLVGPSGAGKSTLMNVLLRLYDIHGGVIAIDGQDIRDVTQDSLRDNIAIIPQDTALFHRSLMDNIRYGNLHATEEQVMEAARLAHAHDFIKKLPEGYGTLVGERGIKLSGGQRQRIAIARAILKNAPILLLDEATSALDSESEKMIQDSLQTLMQGKTVIAIAHRLSTIATMDRLVVMDHGAVVEDGSHAELLAANGLYARLWAMQSGGFLGG